MVDFAVGNRSAFDTRPSATQDYTRDKLHLDRLKGVSGGSKMRKLRITQVRRVEQSVLRIGNDDILRHKKEKKKQSAT